MRYSETTKKWKTRRISEMRHGGLTYAEIAAKLGISKSCACAWYQMAANKSNKKTGKKMCELCGDYPVPPDHRKLCRRCHREGSSTYFETEHTICH